MDDLARWSAFLESVDGILLIKEHPLTLKREIDAWGILEGRRVFFASDFCLKDINYLYGISDVLITDVSSAVFDYAILNRPIIFFMPDVVEYLRGDRGLYDYFSDFILRSSILSWSDLLARLEKVVYGDKVDFPDVLREVASEVSKRKNVNAEIYSDLLLRLAD